jgi:HSP20 family protein
MARAMTPWRGGPRNLTLWDMPLPRWFENFRREMDELFEQFFGPEAGREMPVFAPRTNLAETEKEYEITVDLPGLKPEDFSVELKDNCLWITGERKQEHQEEGKTYHRIERVYGQFRRVIPLEAPTDPEKIQAEYKDGVLRIVVPKEESAQPKKIPVKT